MLGTNEPFKHFNNARPEHTANTSPENVPNLLGVKLYIWCGRTSANHQHQPLVTSAMILNVAK